MQEEEEGEGEVGWIGGGQVRLRKAAESLGGTEDGFLGQNEMNIYGNLYCFFFFYLLSVTSSLILWRRRDSDLHFYFSTTERLKTELFVE